MALSAKLRRIGTSLGVIIPKEELDARVLKEGDEIRLYFQGGDLRSIRGLLEGTPPFKRERRDRVDRWL